MRIALLLVFVLVFAAAWAAAEEERGPVREQPRYVDPDEAGVGSLVADMAFTDLDGTPGRLSTAMGDKGLVIAYTNATCPVCKRYGPRLGRMATRYTEQGMPFLFVNPSGHEAEKLVRRAIEVHKLPGRYVHDTAGVFTRALGAKTTAEVFVLDRARTLVYRGAVDDQYGVGYAVDEPRHRYLEGVLEALVDGRPVAERATTAPGCVLDVPTTQPTRTKITYHAHVSRIVQRKCQSCHRPGENGPFPLMTFEDVKGNAPMIRWVVEKRTMPPWFAGDESLECRNDLSLSEIERASLMAWIDAGTPEGDEADAPRPRQWTQGWKIGKPDAVIQIPREFQIPAEGTIPYRNVTVKTDFPEDRWVKAFEIRPTAPQVVHHVLVFVRYPRGHPRKHEQPRPRGGIDGYFAAMVPGQTAFTFPEGTARFLPKDSKLKFQIHYTTNGEPAVDRTRLGLVFNGGKPEFEMRSTGIHNLRLRIPPGAANHKEEASRMVPLRGRIYGFTPHMHVRGKAFRYVAQFPDRTHKVLLDVPRYDFNWQLNYVLAEPLDVPAGTRIFVTAWYDNSEGNPANPDPTKTVRWGDQTWDEMLIGYVDWHPLPPR